MEVAFFQAFFLRVTFPFQDFSISLLEVGTRKIQIASKVNGLRIWVFGGDSFGINEARLSKYCET